MSRNRIILLVEDNIDDVDLTLKAFENSKIVSEVVVVHDGEEALNYLLPESRADSRVMPEMILLDLNLPKIDGLSVLRRLRSDPRTRLLPVVILTSSSEERDIIASYDLGANSFVQKPVDFGQFVRAAQQLGLYWLALNEPPLLES